MEPPVTDTVSNIFVLGRDDIGTVAEDRDPGYKSGPFRYYLTDCCGASAKGTEWGIACRACYGDVDPSLGMCPDSDLRQGIDGRIVFVDKPLALIDVYGDGLAYDVWNARRKMGAPLTSYGQS